MFELDQKIIIISNEPYSKEEPNKLLIGRFKGYQEVGQNNRKFVLYVEDGKDDSFMSFSTPMPYSIELEKALLKLDWAERWNIFSKGISIIDLETQKRKEQ